MLLQITLVAIWSVAAVSPLRILSEILYFIDFNWMMLLAGIIGSRTTMICGARSSHQKPLQLNAHLTKLFGFQIRTIIYASIIWTVETMYNQNCANVYRSYLKALLIERLSVLSGGLYCSVVLLECFQRQNLKDGKMDKQFVDFTVRFVYSGIKYKPVRNIQICKAPIIAQTAYEWSFSYSQAIWVRSCFG